MKNIIIGSFAQKFWDKSFREPKDFDILVLPEEQELYKTKHVGLRCEPAWYGPSSQWICDNSDNWYASEEVLHTIKAAQLKFDVFWNKTANDVIYYQQKNVPINPELFKLCLADFTSLHGERWAKLKGKDSKTFFKDAVKRKYVHDSIHEAVAYYDRPLYESILTGDGVMCSKDKFFQLPHEDQVRCAKEEIYVTALERFLVPEDFTMNARRAYWLSLKKFITTMSSGWMSKFLIENFKYLNEDISDYVSRFEQNQNKLILSEE